MKNYIIIFCVLGFLFYGQVAAALSVPIISSVVISDITDNSATVSWQTDQFSDSLINYGTTTSYGQSNTLDSSFVAVHKMVISGLAPGQIYHFQVVSKNSIGDIGVSSDTIFATAAYTSVTPNAYGSSDVYPPITHADGNGYVFETFNTFAPSVSQKSVAVTLTCSDAASLVATSGCSSTMYCVDDIGACSPSLSYNGNIIVTDPGTWHLRYYSIDGKGNTEAIKESIVVIGAPLRSSQNTVNANTSNSPSIQSVNMPARKLDIPKDFIFTTTMQVNQKSSDIYYLQQLLNLDTDTLIAVSGPGSPGQETVRFGQLTRLAVIKFQQKYASEILIPAKLTRGTGIVGGNTIKKLNQLLSQVNSQ